MTSVNDIRSAFLDYFAGRGHEKVQSAPLVPQNDPTLMFVNAGMVPFKNVFTGAEQRDYSRATSSQKCVRAGGKHNDLDNVGYTARHHTFFEMLGNFSFGDYFKEEAIESAWTLITKEFGLDPAKLLVTIYHTDDEAADLWKKIAGFGDDKIIRIPTSDNFWSMGDTGPCGPCSEIFYDHGPDIPGGPPGSPEEDGDRFIEIWNLVFMQFERHEGGKQTDLPKPSIDTGMGLERISAVLQGVHDNYDIDLFRTLIEASAELTGKPVDGEFTAAHRVVADHLRASSFLIADGVSPSNEGRGYVLRRIMRRAMRYAHHLGAKEPLLARLAPVLRQEMGNHFPELHRASSLIEQTLRSEEEKFHSLLDRGLKILAEETAGMSKGDKLPGEAAFKLYDTYGFPLDLTQDALRREGFGVDEEGFTKAMDAQRAAARASWAGSGEEATEKVWFDIRAEAGPTEFIGYVHTDAEGIVKAIVKGGEIVEEAGEGDDIEFVVNQTPFYAESGGQTGDTGRAYTDNGAEIEVTSLRKRAGVLHGHGGKIVKGSLAKGEAVRLVIDTERRDAIRANHSGTHLVHRALRNVLGDHVTQKGSLVLPDRFRFDFSHNAPLTDDEIERIETEVNRVIRQNDAAETRILPYDDAVEAGAMALFGEKYDDDVRVLSMGHDLEDARKPYSMELCGGTHVSRTGDVALFTIVNEGGVAAGIRRIEAMTGEGARQYLKDEARKAKLAADALKTTPGELADRAKALADERRKLEREVTELRKKVALASAMGDGGASNGASSEAEDIGGIKFVGRVLDGVPAKELRGMVDEAKSKLGEGVAAFIAVNDGKAAITIGVTEELSKKVSAVDLVRAGAEAIGGKGGGGRPDMAQAGGPNGGEAAKAIDAIRAALG
ncbi:alanine--tRNA ligase [Parvularcula flava]|uniref:Alanine--tRNA ligase n=1 Tax=Aquisalinus luteolus TaxID=1566827 RepID=A0A8J3A1D7_9PROT|nr:alanine--tRNA ligase [Aquisalinus luteolus]NHK26593.1 alanine--tRNA ligase [Aquisalinus luteolus]GGH92809.1 alanine--tRNA ligase [Aquisalinus luteolus]